MTEASSGSLREARVVTISASYGAGGSVIGPMLAGRLSLPFADRLISAHDSRSHTSEGMTAAELDEQPRSPLLNSLALLSPTWNLPTAPEEPEDVPERMREAVEASIGQLAELGGAVILGRAAAVVIGRRERWAFHVRLDGPSERRAQRGARWEGIELDAARARMHTTDHARDQYTQRLYGRNPNDPTLYHLILDSTSLTSDACVDLICTAARDFWAHDDDALIHALEAARRRLLPRGR